MQSPLRFVYIFAPLSVPIVQYHPQIPRPHFPIITNTERPISSDPVPKHVHQQQQQLIDRLIYARTLSLAVRKQTPSNQSPNLPTSARCSQLSCPDPLQLWSPRVPRSRRARRCRSRCCCCCTSPLLPRCCRPFQDYYWEGSRGITEEQKSLIRI